MHPVNKRACKDRNAIERFGIRFVASARHADVLLVIGPVAKNAREALERTYAATPTAKWVVAVGDCAIDGDIFANSHAVEGPRSRRSICTSRPPASACPIAGGPAEIARTQCQNARPAVSRATGRASIGGDAIRAHVVQTKRHPFFGPLDQENFRGKGRRVRLAPLTSGSALT